MKSRLLISIIILVGIGIMWVRPLVEGIVDDTYTTTPLLSKTWVKITITVIALLIIVWLYKVNFTKLSVQQKLNMALDDITRQSSWRL